MKPVVRAYRGDVKNLRALLARVAALPAPVQLARADRVHSPAQLTHAARLATRALAEGRAETRTLQTEILRYAAGERQISRAVEKLGLHEGHDLAIAAIALGDPAGEALDALARAEGWREAGEAAWGGEAALPILGVTDAEKAVVPKEKWADLALEKVALVDVLK